ncbi:MAG: saccharopine dehydrogenase NADP-binding domain-containing protein [Actinomycetota bacterium]|nr:saccharopine dehydrogenase NADP-binding domain-containing protein [Actinomycetota bacterium]
MAQVGLLGASGYTGRLVAHALDRRRVNLIAAARDAGRVQRAVGHLPAVTEVRAVDVTDRDSLGELLAGVDVVVSTVGPFVDLGPPALDAAIRAGVDYVDSTGEQPFLRWAFDERATAAARAGITAVPACGFDYVPGDLLADVAATQVETARDVHVAYLVRGSGGWASRGTRRTGVRALAAPGYAYVDGLELEEPGQVRRLAWFPRPIGPHHVAGFPGGEPVLVPRHVPYAREVRSYVAIPGVVADLAPLGKRLLGWAPARALLDRLLAAGPEGPSPARRRQTRWACAAEVVGANGDVARAWAHGRDVYGFTAEAIATVVARLVAGDAHAHGVVAPAEAFEAADLLDELAAVAGIRWSVLPPAPLAGP